MAISGLIISSSSDSGLPEATLEKLRNHPLIQVGEISGHRVPIVLETADSDESTRMWEWLNSLAGVALVEVAYLHFEDTSVARRFAS